MSWHHQIVGPLLALSLLTGGLFLGCSSCEREQGAPDRVTSTPAPPPAPKAEPEPRPEPERPTASKPTPPAETPGQVGLMKPGTSGSKNLEVEELGEDQLRFRGTSDSGSPFSGQLGGDIEVGQQLAADVPVHPDGQALATMKVEGKDLLLFQVPRGSSDVERFYREELEGQGWSVDRVLKQKGGLTEIHATKSGQTIIASISEQAGTSFVSLTVKEPGARD